MTTLQALILGIVQGVTEFLPVSSSGHLALSQHVMSANMDQPLVFEILVHLGTLLAVVVVYRRDLTDLIGYVVRDFFPALLARRWKDGIWLHSQGRMVMAILVITFVTGVIGLSIKDTIEPLFDNPKAVGGALLFTALILGLTLFSRQRFPSIRDIPLWVFIVIGVAQSMALTPGISRSGSTIAAALLLGVDRRSAGALSFLAAIPAIIGASAMEMDLSAFQGAWDVGATGFVAAAISGWLSLFILLRFVHKGRLWVFAPYCLLVGLWALFFL